MTYVLFMLRTALITTAVAVATVCGGIGLSMAHSAISNRSASAHDGFMPDATFGRATPKIDSVSLWVPEQSDSVDLPRNDHRAIPNVSAYIPEVTQNAIENQGFGSLRAPRIGDRPKSRPYTQLSSADTALVISTPMHTSQRAPTPRRTLGRRAAPKQHAPQPVARRIDGGKQGSALIGVFR